MRTVITRHDTDREIRTTLDRVACFCKNDLEAIDSYSYIDRVRQCGCGDQSRNQK